MSNLGWYWNRVKAYIGRPRLLVQEKPVILNEADFCESPLFIMGAHRSGTSLVRRMFNSHPDIACPPETFFIAEYARMLDDVLVLNGYESFGYDREAMRRDLARKASSLHEAYRLSQGKSLWADKTPRYVQQIEPIDRLFARKARFVLVLRHPADIVHSNYKRGWRFNDIDDFFESTLVYVKDSIDRLLAFEKAHQERCTRIVYRQLCDAPEATLRAALPRIGLTFHSDMLNFESKSHNYGLEDPVVRGKRVVELSAGAWRSWNTDQRQRAEAIFGRHILQDKFWRREEFASISEASLGPAGEQSHAADLVSKAE